MSAAQIVSAVRLGADHLEVVGDCEVTVADLASSPTGLDQLLREAEGLLIDSHVIVDDALLAFAPRLRVISTISAGFDHVDLAAAADRAITVTTAPVLSDAVADLTLALIVMTARRLREATDDLARGRWNDGLLGSDLRAKTLLIVGFGRIGREVARRALACRMDVCAFDARADLPETPGVELLPTLVDGLHRADVVSVHVDLNPTTRHLFDDEAFSSMKPTAIFVNTSRGVVVDQAALTRALGDGRIAGAGLDVLETEPPDPTEPLLSLPNVVVLPHLGSATTETRRAMLDCAVDNLARCLRGDDCEYVLALR